MKELLSFVIENITGIKDFEIEEVQDEGRLSLTVKAPKEAMGIIIGKGGSTIKAIRNILRVRATLDKIAVSVEVVEKQ
ncbi:hypothetical protein A2V61_01660 [Candidatus Woesebacteria bacterium RBG_19FT_COMBO_47_8]|uniref:Uncharacterized protein n=1 Tax=Candidatus Woesebacteria bacterium RBG_13_46_13 TaxID=1802479 RepID=A0A1F7X3N3_9BACT|nr:MAG: hypothetical protein A2Y68_03195 [Candidatus Woesebacteria bacterium RBG_13_46_13]OGM17623.1 MAG: hypothetical protein A2V61_01660 [Candidatus Woesebacteria bacterium RBG_19FT_COMBO_47_8]HJX59568.1 KH domain-containing protein [Patescibacteria group bacterium]